MADTEYKKYDSHDRYEICGPRLAKDAEVRENEHGKMVRLTFCSTSRKDTHSDLWIEANVNDRDAELAACLKKGDTLHKIEGKPALRRFGEQNEKWAISLERASIVVPIALFVECKEKRGFEPGARGEKTAAKAPAKKPTPAGKPTAKPGTPARKIVNLDDDGDE